MRQALARKNVIQVLLVLQLIPFVLFPASAFSTNSQEWWLPVLLAVLVIAADINLLFRQEDVIWPWNLIAFAQGFNVISRLMMLLPHATINSGGVQVFNAPYVILTVVSMLLSVFLLWFVELPEVRIIMIRE